MKVSVITCTWNSSKTLQETIDSVMAQSYPEIEHVFVDGGSTDGTLEIINRYSRAAVVRNNVRGGISNAMNVGVEASKGDVFIHLHSDDVFASNDAVEQAVQAFRSSNTGWVVGQFGYIVHGVPSSAPYVPEVTKVRLGIGNFIPHPATFIRRSYWDRRGGFDTSLKYAMDYDLWFRFILDDSPKVIPTVISLFRQHEGSISTANRRKTLQEELRVRLRYVYVAPQALPRYIIRWSRRWLRNRFL